MYNNESSVGLVPEIVAPDVDAQRVRFAIGGFLAVMTGDVVPGGVVWVVS